MAEARKTVTVLFADVSGSTALGERLDAETLRHVMESYFGEARQALERHGGTVEKFIGDAVMAAFGIPAAHEDDALRAVRAATELLQRLTSLNEVLERERGVTLAVRTGINTGEVVAGDPAGGQFYASGDAVNVAARLQQAAQAGEIVLGEQTYRLVRGAVKVEAVEPFLLKGKSSAVPAYRLLHLIEGAPPLARRFDTPFIGRAEELARLLTCFERSIAERMPVLVTVLGPAGIGKTRLATEVVAQLGDRAAVLQGRCLSYGEGITFLPLEEILRSVRELPSGVRNPEHARSTEETFLAYRKLFEALAHEWPLLLVLEDIHWAEPTLLELIEHVAQWTREAPMLILCLARAELFDARPGWGGELLELGPLTHEEAESLTAALAEDIDPSVRSRSTEVAEGNPLFLEQLLALAGDEAREVALPQTIHALLAARLDQLESEERALVERAAVIGKEFWRGALAHLSPRETEVSAVLQRLVRRRLISPERTTVAGEDAFRFDHILIRDAAYAGIPKGARVDLHERFAAWLESGGSASDEIVGYHLEQAYRYLAELGPVRQRGIALAARATMRLSSAGRRASLRGDANAAANLLGRALALGPPGALQQAELSSELGRVLIEAGQLEQADAMLTQANEAARVRGDRRIEWAAAVERESLAINLDPEGRAEEARRLAEEALAVFQELGDARGLARAWRLVAQASNMAGRAGEMQSALERALKHARRAGDLREEAEIRSWLTNGLTIGPVSVRQAIRLAAQQLAWARATGNRGIEARVTAALGHLAAMRGRFRTAHSHLDEADALARDLGSMAVILQASWTCAEVALLEDDLEAAEANLRETYELLEAAGERGYMSTAAAMLAHALCGLGRDDDALRIARLSEATAGRDDLAPQLLWRGAKARVLARRGEGEEAVALAEEAVRIARRTDFLAMQADALMTLGEVLSAACRADEGARAVDEALRLYERKGFGRPVIQAKKDSAGRGSSSRSRRPAARTPRRAPS